ncbi:MAG TPA: aquaporin [Gaiella sp.]|nr:aquaporin [Gaiella sp.]
MGKTQMYLAEALGTFTLVGIGSFAILSSAGTGRLDVVAIAFGFGLALLVGLYAFGEVSGGHYNPAVSLGLFLDRRLALNDMIAYWIAQVIGAIAASVVVLIAFNSDAVAATTTHSGDNWAGIVVETMMSALFVAVILQSTKSERTRGTALLAIPLTLLAIHVAIIPISGSSVNPARSLGPAIVGTDFGDLWIYLIFPFVGGFLGFLAHKLVVEGDTALGPRSADA